MSRAARQDEAAEILRCLLESLRERPFAAVLAQLVRLPSEPRECSHGSHFLAGGQHRHREKGGNE